MGTNVHNSFEVKIMPSEARLKFLKFKKINILFMLIITIHIFSLCQQIFPCVRTKFPVFSLSGKSKNQIPCFPCAMATLKKIICTYSEDVHIIYSNSQRRIKYSKKVLC